MTQATTIDNPTLKGAQYRSTHKLVVMGILGDRAPQVSSRGTKFYNIDRWTVRVFTREMCKWAHENPQCVPTRTEIGQWVNTANRESVPFREIVIANTPDKLKLRTALALTGGAAHEAFHTYYSCLRSLTVDEMASIVIPRWAKVPDWSKFYVLLQSWSNIIEDIRIERNGREEFPGTEVKLHDLQDFILAQEAAGLKNVKAHGGPAVRGALSIITGTFRDVGLGYNTTSQREALAKYRKDNLQAVQFVLGQGKDNPGPLTALLKETIALGDKDDTACVRIALDVIGILFKESSEQDPANDPNNQDHQPGETQKPCCPACGAKGSKLVIRPKSDGRKGKVRGMGVLTCTVCGHQEDVPLQPPKGGKGGKGSKLDPEDMPKFEGFDPEDMPKAQGGKGEKDDKDKSQGGQDQPQGGDDGDDGDDDAQGGGGSSSSQKGKDQKDKAKGGGGKPQDDSDDSDDDDASGSGGADEDGDDASGSDEGDQSDDFAGNDWSDDDLNGEGDHSQDGDQDGDQGDQDGDQGDQDGDESGGDQSGDDGDGDDAHPQAKQPKDTPVEGSLDEGGKVGESSENEANTDTKATGEQGAEGGGHNYEAGEVAGNDWSQLANDALNSAGDDTGLLDNNSALEGAVGDETDSEERSEGGVKQGERMWKPYDPANDEFKFVPPSKAGKDHDREQAERLYASVKDEASYLRSRLRSIVKAMEMSDTIHGVQRGRRLSSRFLVDSKVTLKAGESPKRAYKQIDEAMDTSLAAAVVIDESGSMDGALKDATRVLCAITEPLDALGCKVQVSGFRDGARYTNPGPDGYQGDYHRFNSITHDIFKTFDEPLRSVKWRFANTRATGGTPMADGVQFALDALSGRPEGHRVMFVITDGQPNGGHKEIIRRQIRLAKAAGIHIIGVGLGYGAEYVQHVFPDSVWTSKISDMPKALIAKLNELVDRRATKRGSRVAKS